MIDLGKYHIQVNEETGQILITDELHSQELVFDNPEQAANWLEDELGCVWTRKEPPC